MALASFVGLLLNVINILFGRINLRAKAVVTQISESNHRRTLSGVHHTQRERGGARPPDRFYSCSWSIWAVSKLPARPRGRWTCSCTVPSADGVDSKVIHVQVEEALTFISLLSRPLTPRPFRSTSNRQIVEPARQLATPLASWLMPNSRHALSREQRSTSSF